MGHWKDVGESSIWVEDDEPPVAGEWIGGGGDSPAQFIPDVAPIVTGGGGDAPGWSEPAPPPSMDNQAAPPWLPPSGYEENGFTPQGNSKAADEAATKAAADLYRAILHREPDAAGLEANKNAILAGVSVAQLAKNMLDSPEEQAFINRAKTNLTSLGKKPEEVDKLVTEYTKNIIDTSGAIVVSPIGYNGAIKVLDGSTMVSPGFFQRPDGSIINIDSNTGNIISATPPYSTYNDSVQINTGYRNNTYSKGTMDGQTSININGVDIPLITPEYLVNPKGQLLVNKDKVPVTIQSIEPPKKANDGLGGVGDFLNANGLAVMLALATAGAASGASAGTLFADAAGAGGLGGAGATLASVIGSSVGLSGTMATAVGGSILGSATSTLLAAANGTNLAQAAIKGAIGGGVGAASLGIMNGILPEGTLQTLSEATKLSPTQISNVLTNAISTAVSAAATGNFNGNVLSLIGNSLASSTLANYAGNIVDSLNPGQLNSVVQAVKAVTQVGTSAVFNGQDFGTAVVNNAGQIVGNIISSNLSSALKDTASAIKDKLNTTINTLLDENGAPTNDVSKAKTISLGNGEAVPLDVYKTAFENEAKSQFSPAEIAAINQGQLDSTKPGAIIAGGAGSDVALTPTEAALKLAQSQAGGAQGTVTVNQVNVEPDIIGAGGQPVLLNNKENPDGTETQNFSDGSTKTIIPTTGEVVSQTPPVPTPPVAPDQNNLGSLWTNFLTGAATPSSTYNTANLTTYTGDPIVPVTVPGAGPTPGTGTTPSTTTGTSTDTGISTTPGIGTEPGTGTIPGTGTTPGTGTDTGTSTTPGTGPGGAGPGGAGPGGAGPSKVTPTPTPPVPTPGPITSPTTKPTTTPVTKTPTTITRTPGSITSTPITSTIPQFGISDIKHLTPGLVKGSEFKFANEPTFSSQVNPVSQTQPFDYREQILNAASGGSTTTTSITDIADLVPGLVKGASFSLVHQPKFSDSLNPISLPNPTDYTQQILNAAQGGLIHMAEGGESPEYPTAPSPTLRAQLWRGHPFGALGRFHGAQLAGYQTKQYAEGGDVQEHHPEFFSEGGLESMENRFVRGDGDGTSDSVPAMLANGEFVIPADVVSKLGNGSNDSGAEILDEFLAVIREHNQKHNPRELPPDSRGPLAYLSEAKRKVG
jgi:hypothetical protein